MSLTFLIDRGTHINTAQVIYQQHSTVIQQLVGSDLVWQVQIARFSLKIAI